MDRIPGIEYAAAPRAAAKASRLAWPPRLIVIHDTGNPNSNRRAEASYAANRTDPSSRWTSAHAYVDADGVLGSLPLSLRAWAAYSYANAHGIHIEMCKPGGTVSGATIDRTGALVRQLADLAGIPLVKLSPSQVAAGQRGVCGHLDITRGLGVGDHTDPGPDFPWARLFAAAGGTAVSTGDDVMGTWTEKITQNAGRDYLSDQQRDTVLAIAAGGAADANNKLDGLIKRLDALPTAPAAGGPAGELTDADVERIASRVADLLAARLGS